MGDLDAMALCMLWTYLHGEINVHGGRGMRAACRLPTYAHSNAASTAHNTRRALCLLTILTHLQTQPTRPQGLNAAQRPSLPSGSAID